MKNKQEKLRIREEMIISKVSSLIIEEGFFNLRMSDVAKNAKVSMGTLYSHFSSKEDLLIGISNSLLSKRLDMMKKVKKSFEKPLDQLVAMIIGDYYINSDLGELSEIETISNIPSVWQRASHKSTELLKNIQENLMKDSFFIISECLNSKELFPNNEYDQHTKEQIEISLWSSCIGLRHIFNMPAIEVKATLNHKDEEEICLKLIRAILKGFGGKIEITDEELMIIAEKMKIKKEL